MREVFRKEQILTVPNFMTFFRILLLPVIIWSYLTFENKLLPIILLAVSALTDVFDGVVARKLNQVSDFGKALDPVADKLTQVSLLVCLIKTHPLILWLLILCVLRETFMFVTGLINVKKVGQFKSARWYGKLSTVLLYGTALALIVFPCPKVMPGWLATALIVLCMAAVVLAITGYSIYYARLWKQADAEKAAEAAQATAEVSAL